MRRTVDFVLKLLGDGYTADEIVAESRDLQKEDVYQAATEGAWSASQDTAAFGCDLLADVHIAPRTVSVSTAVAALPGLHYFRPVAASPASLSWNRAPLRMFSRA